MHPANFVADLAQVAEIGFSLPVSAAGPERTFSLFDWIQSKRRNRLGTDKLMKIAAIKQHNHANNTQQVKSPSSLRKRSLGGVGKQPDVIVSSVESDDTDDEGDEISVQQEDSNYSNEDDGMDSHEREDVAKP